MTGRESDEIPHHLTKESLVDSVLHRSCHLCRFIIFHLKTHWAIEHLEGKDDLKEESTSLTESDFADSDFDHKAFPSDRVVILSYMLDIPENLNFHIKMSKSGDWFDGVFGLVEFDCDALNHDYIKAAIPRFWIFNDKAFGVPPMTSRLNDNTASEICQNTVKMWLEQCDGHDVYGARTHSFLPTRLLDLSNVETESKVRLVLSSELDQTTRYVTLSHCWGGEVPIRLTDATKDELEGGYKLQNMPPTFRDAIMVARWAGVRYIWIDSCCIKQDSPSDWAKEAKMMRNVYQNTYFNISADHSENSQGGLFRERLAYKYTPCPFEAPNVGQVYFLPQFDLMHPLTQAPLASRAWVTQERFLSPRILHFTTDQLFWESVDLYACETFPQGMPPVYDNPTSWHYRTHMGPDRAQEPGKPGIYEVWGRVCEDYSRSRLTYTSDKLIAFAGIAGEFKSSLPDDKYLAGLWKDDLVVGLLWKAMALDGWPTQPNGSRETFADPYITAAKPDKYRAPSWSWLSKDMGIFWQTRVRYSPRMMVDIMDADVSYVNEEDRVGDIQSGHIKLRGRLRDAEWSKEGHIESIIIDGKSGDQLIVSPENPHAPPKVDSFHIQRDIGMEFDVRNIVCLPMRLSVSPKAVSQDNPIIEGLILQPTGAQDTFERIGYFEANGEGYCQALLYELRGPTKDHDRPWDTLNLQPLPEDGDTRGEMKYTFNDKDFKEVEMVVITII
ncbi:hypothetical protein HBI69_098400 [Parastagonospora nodorum]|nr:hypothetical protein HBI69_098400 [Parastagonospora nodorum]